MTTSSILEVIQHYQRSIEKCQNDETRLLHCISKLYKLPVNVEHLQETGIGKTVNSLRKFNGEIGVAAKALVTKWKAMVSAEDEPAPISVPNGTDDAYHDNGNDGGGSGEEDLGDQNTNTTSHEKKSNGQEKISSQEKTEKKENTGSNDSGSRNETSSKSRTSSSDASRPESSKHRKDEHIAHKRKREHGDTPASLSADHKEKKKDKKDREGGHREVSHERKSGSRSGKRDEHTEKHHKSHKADKAEQSERVKDSDKRDSNRTKAKEEKDRSSSKDKGHRSSDKSSSSSDRKRRHDQDSDTKDNKDRSNKPSKTNSLKERKDDFDGGDFVVDSSMGANFEDVLGMLNMPTKKSKKSLSTIVSNNGPSTSASAMSSQTAKEVNGSKDNSKPSTSGSSRNQTDKSYTGASRRTHAVSNEKPDLLSSNAKLDPLDPSIALALPAISTNYKPMPLNQTVMDCVFNNTSSHSTKPPVRTLTDAEALSHGISSKTMRTKIYSGVRTGQLLQVPSLFDLCIRVLQKNIDALEYTGGVPFEVLRPVLERATPQQLMVFEEYNPYLMEDSDVLWQLHVQRNYRTQKRQEMESWREMFMRCQDDQERKLSYLAESIKQSQKIIAAPVRKTQLAFVDSMVKPPRNVQRKQEIHGTKSKLIATPASRVAALSSVTPNAGKVGDVRLRVAASVRDAAQVSHSAVRPKKAPLMAKTLQFMRGRHKR